MKTLVFQTALCSHVLEKISDLLVEVKVEKTVSWPGSLMHSEIGVEINTSEFSLSYSDIFCLKQQQKCFGKTTSERSRSMIYNFNFSNLGIVTNE